VLLVELTPTVRLETTTGRSADARTPTLGTLYRAVVMNVIQIMSADSHSSVIEELIVVTVPVREGSVERTPTVRQSTIGPSVHVLLISSVTPSPVVTQNARDIATVPPTRLVSDSNVKTLVRNPTLTCVDKEQIVRRPIIRQFVPALAVTLEIPLSVVENSKRRIFVPLTLAVLEQPASQVLTDLEPTVLCAPVLLDLGVTLLSVAPGGSVSMTASVH